MVVLADGYMAQALRTRLPSLSADPLFVREVGSLSLALGEAPHEAAWCDPGAPLSHPRSTLLELGVAAAARGMVSATSVVDLSDPAGFDGSGKACSSMQAKPRRRVRNMTEVLVLLHRFPDLLLLCLFLY